MTSYCPGLPVGPGGRGPGVPQGPVPGVPPEGPGPGVPPGVDREVRGSPVPDPHLGVRKDPVQGPGPGVPPDRDLGVPLGVVRGVQTGEILLFL